MHCVIVLLKIVIVFVIVIFVDVDIDIDIAIVIGIGILLFCNASVNLMYIFLIKGTHKCYKIEKQKKSGAIFLGNHDLLYPQPFYFLYLHLKNLDPSLHYIKDEYIIFLTR